MTSRLLLWGELPGCRQSTSVSQIKLCRLSHHVGFLTWKIHFFWPCMWYMC